MTGCQLVSLSPWPLASAWAGLTFTLGLCLYLHTWTYGLQILLLGTILVIYVFYAWGRDVTREATYLGAHTLQVRKSLWIGYMLFLFSEFMLFASLFWAYFDLSASPSIELGSAWPSVGINPIDAFSIPLLNTWILLASGATLTYAHHNLIAGYRELTLQPLFITILLGVIFTLLQAYEYLETEWAINGTSYGSVFFSITGLHGAHVIVGTLFLTVSYYRLRNFSLFKHHHLGFTSAIFYWHAVDVVWLIVYTLLYVATATKS